VYIIDLQSSSGTFVNNRRLSPNLPTLLPFNSIIKFSDTEQYLVRANPKMEAIFHEAEGRDDASVYINTKLNKFGWQGQPPPAQDTELPPPFNYALSRAVTMDYPTLTDFAVANKLAMSAPSVGTVGSSWSLGPPPLPAFRIAEDPPQGKSKSERAQSAMDCRKRVRFVEEDGAELRVDIFEWDNDCHSESADGLLTPLCSPPPTTWTLLSDTSSH